MCLTGSCVWARPLLAPVDGPLNRAWETAASPHRLCSATRNHLLSQSPVIQHSHPPRTFTANPMYNPRVCVPYSHKATVAISEGLLPSHPNDSLQVVVVVVLWETAQTPASGQTDTSTQSLAASIRPPVSMYVCVCVQLLRVLPQATAID